MSIFRNPLRHYCGSLREEHIGQRVTVCGWCARMRDLGGLIFIDLRDREGIVQCVFDEADNKELFDLAFTVRSEFTLKIEGVVRQRSSINDKIPTGRIEILADSLEIYEKADTPPLRSATTRWSTMPCGSNTAIWTCAAPRCSGPSPCGTASPMWPVSISMSRAFWRSRPPC